MPPSLAGTSLWKCCQTLARAGSLQTAGEPGPSPHSHRPGGCLGPSTTSQGGMSSKGMSSSSLGQKLPRCWRKHLQTTLLGDPDTSEQAPFSSNLILPWSEPPVAAAAVLQSPNQLPGLGKHWMHLQSSLLQSCSCTAGRGHHGQQDTARIPAVGSHGSILLVPVSSLPSTSHQTGSRNPSPSLPAPVHFPGKQMPALPAQGSGLGVTAAP